MFYYKLNIWWVFCWSVCGWHLESGCGNDGSVWFWLKFSHSDFKIILYAICTVFVFQAFTLKTLLLLKHKRRCCTVNALSKKLRFLPVCKLRWHLWHFWYFASLFLNYVEALPTWGFCVEQKQHNIYIYIYIDCSLCHFHKCNTLHYKIPKNL